MLEILELPSTLPKIPPAELRREDAIVSKRSRMRARRRYEYRRGAPLTLAPHSHTEKESDTRSSYIVEHTGFKKKLGAAVIQSEISDEQTLLNGHNTIEAELDSPGLDKDQAFSYGVYEFTLTAERSAMTTHEPLLGGLEPVNSRWYQNGNGSHK